MNCSISFSVHFREFLSPYRTLLVLHDMNFFKVLHKDFNISLHEIAVTVDRADRPVSVCPYNTIQILFGQNKQNSGCVHTEFDRDTLVVEN